LIAAPLKDCRAVLASGLDKSERELYLNRGFAFQSAVRGTSAIPRHPTRSGPDFRPPTGCDHIASNLLHTPRPHEPPRPITRPFLPPSPGAQAGLNVADRLPAYNSGSQVWWRADILLVELKHVWRQKDAALVATLNRIRRGEARPVDVEWLNRQCAAPAPASHTSSSTAVGAAQASAPTPRPMLLAPTNAVVSERNSRELQVRPLTTHSERVDRS
jgi:hypothetical protein